MPTKENRKEYRAKWYQDNKERVKEVHRVYHYRTKFGLTVDKYNEKLEQQSYVCEICKQAETIKEPRTGRIRNLSIDHCHTTGKIRGLLCNTCNHVLGKYKDNVSLFQSCIDYLNKYK
jgi:hypothetical protein